MVCCITPCCLIEAHYSEQLINRERAHVSDEACLHLWYFRDLPAAMVNIYKCSHSRNLPGIIAVKNIKIISYRKDHYGHFIRADQN